MKEKGALEFKVLESWRGYLIYVSRTFPVMVPYLKGIHQTLDSWRPNRGADGWKLKQRDIDLLWRGSDDPTSITANLYENYLDTVKPVEILNDDLSALEELCETLQLP